MTIIARLQTLNEQILATEQAVGRKPGQVSLLAVSKEQPASAIREAYQAGQRAFGENYLQEALQKQQELQDLDIDWHFIGRIQTNKTQAIAQHFNWIQTLDRVKVAERIHEQRPNGSGPMNVCIQVNIDKDPNKAGVEPENIRSFFDQLRHLDNIRVRGLMCIPKQSADPAESRASFAKMRDLAMQCSTEMDTLSMGMSGDWKEAVAEGATMVRLGTALFGPRPQKTAAKETK